MLSRNSIYFALGLRFDIPRRNVRAAFAHIVRNLEIWSDLMGGKLIERATKSDDSISERTAELCEHPTERHRTQPSFILLGIACIIVRSSPAH